MLKYYHTISIELPHSTGYYIVMKVMIPLYILSHCTCLDYSLTAFSRSRRRLLVNLKAIPRITF